MNAPFRNRSRLGALADPQSVKILLWDIDGTLIRSTVAGAYKKYFSATMIEMFGSEGALGDITASGMTDSQIMYEALRSEGFSPDRILRDKERLLKVFREQMTNELSKSEKPYDVLPGAAEILKRTDESPLFVNGLLTGNLSVAAEIKLSTVGLWQYFSDAPNAFGELSHERTDLAEAAGRQFSEFFGFDFVPEQFIVIGDTPNDIACARHFGAKVVAVKTGRNQSAEKLSSENPDALLDDLSETEKVLELLNYI